MVGKKKKTTKKKPKQKTLKLNVKTDAVGRAAKKYLKTKNALADAKENLANAADKLVTVMRKAKRRDIKVDGVIITVRHIEAQDLISVKKPKT